MQSTFRLRSTILRTITFLIAPTALAALFPVVATGNIATGLHRKSSSAQEVADRQDLAATDGRLTGYGAHVLAQSDPTRYAQLIANGGATSLRDDIFWYLVEPARGHFDWSGPDQIVTVAAKHHLHVLMIVDTSPAWASGGSVKTDDWFWLPPRHPSDYGAFAAAVAARYRAGGRFWKLHPQVPRFLPAGIELWNEENLAGFWGGRTPDPARYTAMIKAAFLRIKKADPAMTVVTGGLAPAGGYNDVTCDGSTNQGNNRQAWNSVNFLQAMYAHGLRGHFDALGWHPYNYWSGATATQMLAFNTCSAWSQMAATPVSARSLMTAHGDSGKRIWDTESGAPTCVSGATYPCVTLAQQASLASREAQFWQAQGWTGGFYWYDIRDDIGHRQDLGSHFGTVRRDNSPKPAYKALRLAWRESADRATSPGLSVR